MNTALKEGNAVRYEEEEIRELRFFVSDMLSCGVLPARLAAEAQISVSAFAEFMDGANKLPVLNAIERLQHRVTPFAIGSDHAMIPIARKIIGAFDRARAPRLGMQFNDQNPARGIALIYGAAGVGKTATAKFYAAKNNVYQGVNKLPVLLLEVDGGWNTRSKMIDGIVEGLRKENIACRWEDPIKNILEAIPYGGIIILDEAQRLSKVRMDELRIFPDNHEIGIAFMGNLDGYAEFVKRKMDQISRRVNGQVVHIQIPTDEDVLAILEKYEINGPGLVEFSLQLGVRSCGIDYLVKTICAAKRLAAVYHVPVDIEIFKQAAIQVGAWSKSS